MQLNKPKMYPSWTDLMAILGVLLAAMVVGGLGGSLLLRFTGLSEDHITLLIYLFSFSITILYALLMKSLRAPDQPRLLHFGWKKTGPALLLWGVITVTATTITIDPLLDLFPKQWLDLLADRMGQGSSTLFTAIIAAPLLEEILFRGIIQESITRKYGPWRGILIASAIFGIVHGIPQQVINAFFVGCVLGYIYYRTHSLIPVILIHAFNNAISYFSWIVSDGKIVFTRQAIGNDTIYYLVYGVCCTICLIGVIMIVKTLRQNNQKLNTNPEPSGEEVTSSDLVSNKNV